MKKVIDFLAQLRDNNNREWFNQHKAEYLEAKAEFDVFAQQLIDGIRAFDPSITPLTVADCTYRIYRDTRFSTDKRPYKTHMGVFICPHGKKSPYSGYYFQVGPDAEGYDSGCMLATGNYYCDSPVLKILREDIADDTEGLFAAAIASAKGFTLDTDNALKRIPKGYDPEHPRADLLRLRNFCLVKYVTPSTVLVLAPDLLPNLLRQFQSTAPFLHLINRAVAFALGESN